MTHDLSCGEHITLARNDAVHITRCPCGTVHLTVLSSGVTLQIDDDTLRAMCVGAEHALQALESAPHVHTVVN